MIRPSDLTNRMEHDASVPPAVPAPTIEGLEHEEQRHEPIEESSDNPRQPQDVPPPAEDVQPHDDAS